MAEYNSDIHVSDQVANRFPAIKPLLQWKPLGELFDAYDKEAKHHKARFGQLGTLALGLGFAALIGVTSELVASAVGSATPQFATIIIEGIAVASVLLLVALRVLGHRAKYVVACFRRERLRQWRFQLFLDGQAVESICTASGGSTSALQARLDQFNQMVTNGTGATADFVHSLGLQHGLMHPITPYSQPSLLKQVLGAMSELRFDEQARYTHDATSEESAGGRRSLHLQLHWAEALGKLALLGALVLPSAHLVAMTTLGSLPHTVSAGMAGIAVCLASLSAVARSYLAGRTLPQELDSYQEYLAHVVLLRSAFRRAGATPATKLQCLSDLEVAAEHELRRFLAMKQRATFVA